METLTPRDLMPGTMTARVALVALALATAVVPVQVVPARQVALRGAVQAERGPGMAVRVLAQATVPTDPRFRSGNIDQFDPYDKPVVWVEFFVVKT